MPRKRISYLLLSLLSCSSLNQCVLTTMMMMMIPYVGATQVLEGTSKFGPAMLPSSSAFGGVIDNRSNMQDTSFNHWLDFDNFFTTGPGKVACGEDIKACEHALTTFHCLSRHRHSISMPCVKKIEEYVPHLCAIEIDRYSCNGIEKPVVACLSVHLDDISDDCIHTVLIGQRMLWETEAKNQEKSDQGLKADFSKPFSGCQLDYVKEVMADQCCLYDPPAIDETCNSHSLEHCAKMKCEVEGNGAFTKSIEVLEDTRMQKAWAYKCCPDESSAFASLFTHRSFSRGKVSLLSIILVFIMVLGLFGLYHLLPYIDTAFFPLPYRLSEKEGHQNMNLCDYGSTLNEM